MCKNLKHTGICLFLLQKKGNWAGAAGSREGRSEKMRQITADSTGHIPIVQSFEQWNLGVLENHSECV